MDDDLQGTCNFDLDLVPLSPTINGDPPVLAQQHAHAGGVGTTTYHDNAAASFVLDPNLLTPASTPPGSASHYPPSPLTPAIPPATPQSPSDQNTDSSSSSPTARSPGEYRCDFPECETQPVFKLKCKLRKHMNNHTRPHKCLYCTTFQGGAERKDLLRHLRNHHADEPEVQKDKRVWRQHARCPRCDALPMRVDNLKRHMKTCRLTRGA